MGVLDQYSNLVLRWCQHDTFIHDLPPHRVVVMAIETLTDLVGFPDGWLVGVSFSLEWGYQCWVITPERQVYTDGEFYESSFVALSAGRFLVEHSLEVE